MVSDPSENPGVTTSGAATSGAALHVIVLAAGLGTRMKSKRPKVMHPVAGRPMLGHVLAAVDTLTPSTVTAVVGPEMAEDQDVRDTIAPHALAVQQDRLGTAHAVLAARDALSGIEGDVLVVFGDTPLITPETLSRMVAARRDSGAGVVVLGFEPEDAGAYGRLIVGAGGDLQAIVEAKDATPEQLDVRLCNSGVMVLDAGQALGWLDRIGNDNAKGEYYLTDVVALARTDGRGAMSVTGDPDEVLGVNSRAELAVAEAIVQTRLRGDALAGGATLTDPASVYFSFDTRLGRDVTIGPNVVFGPGVTVDDDVEIRAFSHIEGARIASGAVVGPFARLRPGADLGADVRIGNFVEVKNAALGQGAKVNHLSYVGDSEVGAKANIGAGTITCNYDGFFKSKTIIGAGAFIGSNTALVAPVTVGAGAIIGAGSAISKNVPADALSVTRAPQRDLKDWAARFNTQRAAEKAAQKKK